MRALLALAAVAVSATTILSAAPKDRCHVAAPNPSDPTLGCNFTAGCKFCAAKSATPVGPPGGVCYDPATNNATCCSSSATSTR
mgnify:CR=1 FL=1